ncbi:flagellar hook-basal body complex protein FliE [Shouchella clausii]|uniref:Flagellar hook-basal body complex protein FliE n=1 Tax=Shouchella clausii TaxID=79880 RepID=A0A268S3P6_SHOCL|nr:flagellar hook-basal body complex protein FliE [Shouchella clausii]PAD44627.1 flagellar hook-basal body complex protein FliE [Bacillus sp. 7520-S]AST97512.1 flagellar hook-basal body complex protein FliE [Shouchella clausii]MBU8594841.1 flagellar hook-basal body complex protein FliE [Shouchella clausii]MCR1286280.1 flagellar hook-basal body complex protein FliE [Shouchella clausii]MCY1104936.1 flagellar hook-basal body complex protein FliE [Shouchella clausii]
MTIEAMQPLLQPLATQTGKTEANSKGDFKSALMNALQSVNQDQLASSEATQALVKQEPIDVHDVMIAASKASVSMQAALEVRNKAVEAYQEMMRMQI